MAQTGHSHIIAVGSQKGGVAKTTNCVHIAAALAERGHKCLIWDLDMNHGATLHLGVPSHAFLGAFEVLTGTEAPEDVIITNQDHGVELPDNLALIPGGRHLERIDHAFLIQNQALVNHDMLIKPLASLNGTYDYIFLDTAPNLTLPTLAAYKAAEHFILSVMPDPFAIAGLGNALRDLHAARTHCHSGVRLLGVVISCFDSRLKMARSLLAYTEEHLTLQDGTPLSFATKIARSTVVPQAQQAGKTLFQTHPNHQLTQQYRDLAQEIEARLKRDA